MLPRRLLLCVCALVVLSLCGCARSLKAADSPARDAIVPVWAVQAQAVDAVAKTPAASASFKKTLSAAAEKAYRAGQITRWDLAKVRLAILVRPQAIAECQACVTEDACQAGMIPVGASDDQVASFDWGQILSFVISKLPEILALLKLFAV
jgi:hypothetical protein